MSFDPSEIPELDLTELSEEAFSDLLLLDGGSSEPYYVISGSGLAWYLDPESKQFVQISRGTEVVPVDDPDAGSDRVLVRAPYRFLLVPPDEILEIGWN